MIKHYHGPISKVDRNQFHVTHRAKTGYLCDERQFCGKLFTFWVETLRFQSELEFFLCVSRVCSWYLKGCPGSGLSSALWISAVRRVEINFDVPFRLSWKSWFGTWNDSYFKSAKVAHLVILVWNFFKKRTENFFFGSYGSDFCFRRCLQPWIKSVQSMVDVREVPENIFGKNDPPPQTGVWGGSTSKTHN